MDASPECPCPSVNAPQTVMSIVDCTSHMSDGGKKDAAYIMEHFFKKSE